MADKRRGSRRASRPPTTVTPEDPERRPELTGRWTIPPTTTAPAAEPAHEPATAPASAPASAGPGPAEKPTGHVLPRSPDEQDVGWGRPTDGDDDDRILREVPPHWQ